MPFVITSGTKQYLVTSGQTLIVDHIKADEGAQVQLPVLFSFGEGDTPSTLSCTVVRHQKGKKIRVVKYRPKSRYHKQYGPRQYETVLLISSDTQKIQSTSTSDNEIAVSSKSKKATNVTQQNSDLADTSASTKTGALKKRTTRTAKKKNVTTSD